MRSDRVVVAAPSLDDDPGLLQSVEDLAIEQFIAQAGVEALNVAVLPGTARRDIGCLCTDRGDPVLDRLYNELRAIVGTDIARNASQDEEIGQHIDHIDRLEFTGGADAQAFKGIFIDHVEHAVFATVMSAVFDEVIRPDMVAELGPQADAGAFIKP